MSPSRATKSRLLTCSPALSFFAVILLVWLPSADSSTPNIIISADGMDETWYGKRAVFGSEAEFVRGTLIHTPDSDRLLCQYHDESRNGTYEPDPSITGLEGPIILMTPRGSCTFEKKAWVAQEIYGAVGILVYDNLAGRYSWNATTQRVIFPKEVTDYECENGFGSMTNLTLDPPPYDGDLLNPLLDRNLATNQCNLSITTRNRKCKSQLCLVTSHKENSTEYPVCCAWDNHVTMLSDKSFKKKARKIFAVMIKIRQSEIFLSDVLGKRITMESRPYNAWNASMFFLWILGTAVTGYSCWYSAQNYRYYRAKLRKIKEKKSRREGADDGDPEAAESDIDVEVVNIEDTGRDDKDDEDESEPAAKSENENLYSLPPSNKRKSDQDDQESPIFAIYFNRGKEHVDGKAQSSTLFSLPPPEKKRKKKIRKPPEEDDLDIAEDGEDEDDDNDEPDDVANSGITTMEMSVHHVAIFVLVASTMLLLLFFLAFYNFITIIYAIGCAGAVSFLIFAPIIAKIAPKLGDDIVEELNKKVLCNLNGFDVISQGAGYIWAAVWIWYGLTHYRPSQNWFFWISLDVFGACFCILMLSMFKLNSLKIAALLGIAVFFYDIFFVFITPFLTGGESIMLTVARGGAEGATGGDDLCFKYPKHKDCTGMDFLPMLLAFPRINDYRGGASLLGLGDIVLPGFLISFAARVDEAKRLLDYQTSVEVIDVPHKWYQGYFFPLMVAYAFGLLLANVAVVLMQQGQPALLYLVPCCLGTMAVVGRKEWGDMWQSSKVLRTADKLIRKCDKHWGQQRMKRLVERRKRENAALAAGQRRGSRSSTGLNGGGRTRQHDGPPQQGGPGRGNPTRQASGGRGRGPGRGAANGRGPGGGRGRGRGHHPESQSKPKKGGRRAAAPGAQATPSSPNGPTNSHDQDHSPELSASISPKIRDVCFGKRNHPGTEDFHQIVHETARKREGEEYGPPVYKAIRKQLQGRRLLKASGSGKWEIVSKTEAVDMIKEAYISEMKRI